jgi:hypothetical protein
MMEPKADGEDNTSEKPGSWSVLKKSFEILVRREFYLLFFTRMSFTIITFTMSTYYKSFAFTFIKSDRFITTYIGTISGLLQLVGRTSYGLAVDFIPYKWVMCFQTALLGTLVASLYVTVGLGHVAFTLWMYLIYMTAPGIFAILPGDCRHNHGFSMYKVHNFFDKRAYSSQTKLPHYRLIVCFCSRE